MLYPVTRLRRLRSNEQLREMVQETQLCVRSLVFPLFVVEGKNVKEPVKSMPGNFRMSIDNLLKEAKELTALHIPAVLLFGIPERKDERATSAYAKNGIVQKAVAALKEKFPNLLVITDVCLCSYTNSGHCGIVKVKTAAPPDDTAAKEKGEAAAPFPQVQINNDLTLELLAKAALSHAEAGADMVAPSSMMDGQVGALRAVLDANNFKQIPIMGYSAKFASCFYVPFRGAAGSGPEFGDRKTYQMNPANAEEALREIELDIREGADIIMVKPALSYLDVIARAKERFHVPLAAYNVSGEFAMVKAAAQAELLDEKAAAMEILLSIRRAGADIIISYHSKDAARWMSGQFLL